MGFLSDVKAKMARRKEERIQRETMSRPARLSAMQKERQLYQARNDELRMQRELKMQKQEYRRQKLAPVTNTLRAVGNIGKNLGAVAEDMSRQRGSDKVKGVKPVAAKKDIFGSPDKDKLFSVKDFRE